LAVRVARGAGDLYAIVEMARRFTTETGYDIAFDPEPATNYIWSFIESESCDALVWDEGGTISGGALVAVSHEAHAQPFCYICKFFVAPEARRSRAAREIISACIEWSRQRDCSHVFSTATAGLSEKEQRLAVNLLKRCGLEDVGPVMALKLGKAHG